MSNSVNLATFNQRAWLIIKLSLRGWLTRVPVPVTEQEHNRFPTDSWYHPTLFDLTNQWRSESEFRVHFIKL